MTTYTVTGVRREHAPDGGHRHIEGVCTEGGGHYTRREVFDSISAGDRWETAVDGAAAAIMTTAFCPAPGCLITPYLRTEADLPGVAALDGLPDC